MKRMKERGFKVSPVTVGLCEKDPSICFSWYSYQYKINILIANICIYH